MIWQAGGQPYAVDGTDVTLDFTDEGSTQFAELWQQLIDEDLLDAPPNLLIGTVDKFAMLAWTPAARGRDSSCTQ